MISFTNSSTWVQDLDGERQPLDFPTKKVLLAVLSPHCFSFIRIYNHQIKHSVSLQRVAFCACVLYFSLVLITQCLWSGFVCSGYGSLYLQSWYQCACTAPLNPSPLPLRYVWSILCPCSLHSSVTCYVWRRLALEVELPGLTGWAAHQTTNKMSGCVDSHPFLIFGSIHVWELGLFLRLDFSVVVVDLELDTA